MKMIIGGAYQGKEAFARASFPELTWTDGREASLEDLFRAEGILNFQDFIRREVSEGREVSGLAEQLISRNPEAVIVCQEVGYGVVPMDRLDREYREAVGRVCTVLASFSTQVTRVICGIGTVIKDV